MDKRDTVQVFRERLLTLIARTGLTRSKFAASAGLDRSTLSQLLSPANVRLPRVETIAQIAHRHSASVDWLVGLSQQDHVAADVVPQLMIESSGRASPGELLDGWLAEARGSKIRYVPALLPDQLKTEAVIAHEAFHLEAALAKSEREVIEQRITHARETGSDIEVCSSLQSVRQFTLGEGVWHAFPLAERIFQLNFMADQLEALYPAYRWFLFDARTRYSVPYTVFGSSRAAVYNGSMYFSLTSTDHINELTRHFEDLICHAVVHPHELPALLRNLTKEVKAA